MREDLTDEDMNRLDNVRKQIWAAGYTGFFIGGAWGLGNCIIYKASTHDQNMRMNTPMREQYRSGRSHASSLINLFMALGVRGAV